MVIRTYFYYAIIRKKGTKVSVGEAVGVMMVKGLHNFFVPSARHYEALVQGIGEEFQSRGTDMKDKEVVIKAFNII